MNTDTALENIRECQAKVHRWGKANATKFDADKESSHILSRLDNECHGEPFKNLGITFDAKLQMDIEINKLTIVAGWKIKRILRGRRFFFDDEVVLQFKTFVWSGLEYRTIAIYHATETLLSKVGKLQTRFLHRLGYSEEPAFEKFKMAPLELRRDIAMLGLIHKSVRGEAHPEFSKFFTLTLQARRSRTRLQNRRHLYQLDDQRNGQQLAVWERSIFGLVSIYNQLPERMVMNTTVRERQGMLQFEAFQHMKTGRPNWKCIVVQA